tara:strand:+ start:817 stop:1026 length:210 start_codon:yes stop_codon:yes gene_type:complete
VSGRVIVSSWAVGLVVILSPEGPVGFLVFWTESGEEHACKIKTQDKMLVFIYLLNMLEEYHHPAVAINA